MIPLTDFPIFGKMNLLKLQNKGIYQRKYFNPFAVPSCCNRVGEGLRKQVHCRLHKGKILKGGKVIMYYFKKISLSNRKMKLVKQISKLNNKITLLKNDSEVFNRKEISLLNSVIDGKQLEIMTINEVLEYFQKEKPKPTQKVNNNSFIATAKNDSGAKIQLPPLSTNKN
ncbi:MAG: hypothetical protein HFE40_05070 [Clostridia bacterium]|nr:hypothetical protein [Clostridia bacterium]